jgi:O-antigen/teichoic acid export membrane protein
LLRRGRNTVGVSRTTLRSGVIVFIGVGVANVGGYLFHLVSARSLGPDSYGDVATLAAVIGVVTLPLSGAQVFIARHVASGRGKSRSLNDANYVTGFGGAMLTAGSVLATVLLVLSPVIQRVLGIQSLMAVVIAILVVIPSFLAPVLIGAVQGQQRFVLLASALAIPAVARVAAAAVALAVGFGVAGTMGATFVAALVALAIPLVTLRHGLAPLRTWRPRLSRTDALAVLPVVAGTLAITCLTTDDLVAAKVVFTSHEAGLYGAASLIGRVILYLPLAIVTVLLPDVSTRVSEGRDTSSLLIRSLLATAALCLAFGAVYVVLPHLIVRVAVGSSYSGSSSLLWMFAVAMTLYSLLNVILFYRLGHGETRICWVLLGGAVVQGAIYAAFHSTPQELLAASIATGAVLLAVTAAGVQSLRPTALRHRIRPDPLHEA